MTTALYYLDIYRSSTNSKRGGLPRWVIPVVPREFNLKLQNRAEFSKFAFSTAYAAILLDTVHENLKCWSLRPHIAAAGCQPTHPLSLENFLPVYHFAPCFLSESFLDNSTQRTWN